jgi:hypothetical protein
VASFGQEVGWRFLCPSCAETQVVSVNLEQDIPVRELTVTSFTFEGRRGTYKCGFPRGSVNARILKLGDSANNAAVLTEILWGSIQSLDEEPLGGIEDVRSLPTADREGLFLEISRLQPAVLFGEVKKACPTCENELDIPLSLAALFRGRMGGI